MQRLLFSLFYLILIYYLTPILSIADCSLQHSTILQQWADSWVDQWSYLPHANDEVALNFMLNFLYISYERSRTTLAIQKSFLPIYQHMHESVYDVVKRRRNTSKQQEFPEALTDAFEDMAHYVAAHQRYHAVMNYHAQVSDDVLKNGYLGHEMLTTQAAELHEYTRTVIMCYAGDVKSYMRQFKSLLHNAHDITDSARSVTRSLLGYLEDTFPSLAFNAFVKMDNAFISSTKIAQQLQYDLQRSSSLVWEAIETARGNFYKMMYEKLYAYAAMQGVYGTHMYDIPTDLVSSDDTMIPLPQPDGLEL